MQSTLSLFLFLTLYEVQLGEEFQFFGDVQLEVSEGRVGGQLEALEVLDGFAQSGAEGRGRQGRELLETRRRDVSLVEVERAYADRGG